MKALVRAFRWQRLLDEGRYASITEMARAEKIERGYLGRVLRLALIAPDLVEAVLNGTQGAELRLPRLLDWGAGCVQAAEKRRSVDVDLEAPLMFAPSEAGRIRAVERPVAILVAAACVWWSAASPWPSRAGYEIEPRWPQPGVKQLTRDMPEIGYDAAASARLKEPRG